MIISRVIGIDLGTTNSAVAMLELNERDLLLYKDAQARTTTPSCVWQDPRTKEIVVGHRAYARKGTMPPPVSSIKRSMGTQMTVGMGGKQYTPVEISAFILRELKKQIESEFKSRPRAGLEYDIHRAIITVPAYFGLPAIEATREAGKLAGLEVTELLHEPTAAAIYYSWRHDLGDGVYMVYDLGGGTFDVSILRRTSGEFLVLGISGDNFLGGDDFDRRLAEHLRKLLVADGYKLDLDVNNDAQDLMRFNQLVALAERAKKELSSKDEILLRDQGTLRDQDDTPVIIETSITRRVFESLIDDLLERTISCCHTALKKAQEKSDTGLENVDHILLVGGSTYVPTVLEKVETAFCRRKNGDSRMPVASTKPVRDEPENAVALGAALRAAATGLGICDEKKSVRIWFRGSGATKREQTTISGYLETLEPALDLNEGSIRLSNAAGEQLGEAVLKPGLKFGFPKVALQPETLNEFRFEVLDKSGRQVALVQRAIAQAAGQKEAVGSALSTAVLPKPIVMEGTDGDRLVRRILLAEGTSLPANAKFTFAISDASGFVRLPIYQENRIIKELQAEIGKIAVGTPVEIEIHCDEQVNIQVNVSVGGKSFGGKIAPPPPDAVPTEYEIQQTNARFNQALQRLDKPDALRLKAEYERKLRDVREAILGADYPKVIQRAKDLEGLFREARLLEPLRPPLAALEEKYAASLKLLAQAQELKSGIEAAALRDDLAKAVEKGRQAYQQRDREAYAEATQIVATSLQFLANMTKARPQAGREVDEAMRTFMLVDECRQSLQFLLINCLMNRKIEHLNNLKKQLEEVDKLEEQANSDPVGVANRCQVLITEARRIYQQIMPEDKRTKELGGLLKLDAHKHAPNIGTGGDLFNVN